jgi:short-subunit dehydrogenase
MAANRGSAVITGAGSGIGREVARRLASRGWSIAAIDQNSDGLETLKSELDQACVACEWRRVDVTDAVALSAQVAELEAALGPTTLLVACAGTAGETPAQNIDAHRIEEIIRVNLIGVSNSIAAVLPGMLRRQAGHLVAISSLAALRGLPCQMAYCASKAGVNALMESLRLDIVGHSVSVTTICPGWTHTALTEGRYDERDMMPVEQTAQEIVDAIEARARFHAFPRMLVWQLSLMKLLPTWLQDRLIAWRFRKVRKGKDCIAAPQETSRRHIASPPSGSQN